MQLVCERKLGNFRVEEEKIKDVAMIVKVRGAISIGSSCFALLSAAATAAYCSIDVDCGCCGKWCYFHCFYNS